MQIAFAHHLSLSYNGGGEKWLVNVAKALSKKHNVEIHALPILLDGKPKINPKTKLDGISYTEGFHHKIKADVTYVTYNPLSWLNFQIVGPKIAGLHSEAYWQKPNLHYGKYPLIANIVNRFVSYSELRRFNAIHCLNNLYPVNHPSVYTIPDFVDSNVYRPSKKSDDFTIAFASRHVWQKGFDVFSKVAEHAKCNVKISGNIVEDGMPGFLSDAHAVLVPSRVDTFGLTIVESLMCGTPVITSPIPSHLGLGLPLRYASTVKNYLAEIEKLQSTSNYGLLSDSCRASTMKYDKQNIMSKLENMLCQVAES